MAITTMTSCYIARFKPAGDLLMLYRWVSSAAGAWVAMHAVGAPCAPLHLAVACHAFCSCVSYWLAPQAPLQPRIHTLPCLPLQHPHPALPSLAASTPCLACPCSIPRPAGAPASAAPVAAWLPHFRRAAAKSVCHGDTTMPVACLAMAWGAQVGARSCVAHVTQRPICKHVAVGWAAPQGVVVVAVYAKVHARCLRTTW